MCHVVQCHRHAKKIQNAKMQNASKTYNIRDSPVVTHPSTSLTITGLSMGERTGSRVFQYLWSYVTIPLPKHAISSSGSYPASVTTHPCEHLHHSESLQTSVIGQKVQERFQSSPPAIRLTNPHECEVPWIMEAGHVTRWHSRSAAPSVTDHAASNWPIVPNTTCIIKPPSSGAVYD
ncbi:hypothetical protein CONLIGDRAFT_694095 [Coniochaeta ligniaria NRRL 30616]|uniref:Uncharacterized protein n=1 Tax=Coniochaeta ligniaria NRRL 30616 TaxID=1408157 RepID=A0A1J7J1V4_9PEZI|nr:hypothetical protein CONLIGDRAFT_694095 [Coniochaeta ligniaria NRRL 30616]